jgi:hypothetical protein
VVTKQAINLAEKLSQFDEHWSPRTVTTFNGHDVMVVKVKGEFKWHHHDNELGPGELFVVPVGVEHQPIAVEEAELLLIEPTGTPNTGNAATAAQRIEI